MSIPDDEVEYLTHQEAIDYARSLAKRELVETSTRITFVTYSDFFHDHCRFEIHEVRSENWEVSFRSLTEDERTADERIDDDQIRQLAETGQKIAAIRLYRCKYNADLAKAKAAVEAMQR